MQICGKHNPSEALFFFFFSVGKLMGARSRKSCFSQSLSLTSGSVGVFTSALAKLFLLRYEELYVHLFQH